MILSSHLARFPNDNASGMFIENLAAMLHYVTSCSARSSDQLVGGGGRIVSLACKRTKRLCFHETWRGKVAGHGFERGRRRKQEKRKGM